MSKLNIRKVAVLGAGVMGAQIAAHLVNARVPVLLFDLAGNAGDAGTAGTAGTVGTAGTANRVVEQALQRLGKLQPAPLADTDDLRFIEPANYDDDLARLGECDLVIEAIAERLDLKHGLYARIANQLAPHAILASNTSGLPIASLAEGLPAELLGRFCGVHFFNPPRYMHLVELIPTAATDAPTLDALEAFLTSVLGKGVVRAKDTPNFIANRVGVFSILAVIEEGRRHGLSFDLIDDLTGARLGRAKSATFRTADVVGLDTLAHVIGTMQERLQDDPFFAHYRTPEVLARLIEGGALGQKRGAGFYRKEGRAIKVLDPATGSYVEGGAKADEIVARILKRPPAERFKLLRESSHPQARFLWAIFRDVFHYVAVHLEAIAGNARDVDLAVRWGFGWQRGPFEEWQQAGWGEIARWIDEDIAAGQALSKAPLPDWVRGAAGQGVHRADGSYSPATGRFEARSDLPVYRRQIARAPVLGQPSPAALGETLFENDSVRLWLAPGHETVPVLSFKTKMNTMSAEVLDGIGLAVERAEAGFDGLVIWQTSALQLGTPGGPFSAGANLEAAMPLFMSRGAAGVEPLVRKFQDTMQRVKYAQVPVVAALAGIALGGGCELALHCARRVAHLETYLGLVEVGVGLVPAGGGLKETVVRAARAARATGSTRYLDFISPRFTTIALGKVSGSARQAVGFGYLEATDPVVFNVHELLGAALTQARALAQTGYRPPLADHAIPVAGRAARATIEAQLVNMREGGFISEHDMRIGKHIATILCGGDLDAGETVDEAWLLTLERQAFIELLGTGKTQERIMGMLQTGKPVRN
ncbi:3-hydroxyacyl-CoA dehydrogenase/enoyl-CoA hydratase family protein [Chitinasiproducens palmae]|uniref:3-hydroxyacyl-CoA dehydrogenase n=1 Tax=Chitinasiproducens palmae TaxID=1770053 RepID=A0A1H2PPD1_9BURK|nr:3-hydroxyacyl-CoA dehydrogenase/enoyl-CoA hydratase family protein [Chitinasiproducens palmae]SDV48159.1 3-hydroxyacyl-CoA dehydrogenase [Chitinasiproducens palmae]